MNAGQGPDFDSIRQTNVYDMEYWSARDLMPLLGYGSDHFTDASKMITTGKGAARPVKDYNLSRLACYLIAQNGDPRKPEIAAAQLYFAVSTRANEMRQLREEQERRLEMRLKVSESYKQLGKAAQQAGVQSESFGIFIDSGYLGLHRHTRQELMVLKDIPEGEDYLDNIGRAELSAIDFKNNLTEGKLTTERITGLDEASQAHYFVGDQVRKAIEAVGQPYPEDLPAAASIRKMVEERRRTAKKRTVKAKEQGEQPQLFHQSEDQT